MNDPKKPGHTSVPPATKTTTVFMNSGNQPAPPDSYGFPMDDPALAAQETAEPLVIEIARELYDRFVMGGWEPQDAYPQIEGWLASLRDERARIQRSLEILGGRADLEKMRADIAEEKVARAKVNSDAMVEMLNHARKTLGESIHYLREQVARLEKERGQCPLCQHEWTRHDPRRWQM